MPFKTNPHKHEGGLALKITQKVSFYNMSWKLKTFFVLKKPLRAKRATLKRNNRTSSIKRTYGRIRFHMACKEGQFDVVELMVNDQFKDF